MRYSHALGALAAVLLPAAAPAATAEANLRIGYAAKTPVAAIEANLSVLKTDRRLLDEIAARLVLAITWKLDADQTAKRLAEKLSISIHQQGATATIQGIDDDPAVAAILANTAASVLRDHYEHAKIDHLKAQVDAADQKDRVEDKRKLLSQIIRTEGVVHQGDAPQEDSIHRDADGTAFINAKDDFEEAQRSLETLQIKVLSHRHFSINHIRWASVPAK
jgi:hypothetical protein